MDKLKAVKTYLTTLGVNEEDIKAIYGFLYAKKLIPLGEKLDFKPTKNSFCDFIEWFESNWCGNEEDEEEDNEMDGGVFNDENKEKTISALWLNIHDITFDCIDSNFDEELYTRSVVKIDALLECIAEKLVNS